MKAKNGFNLRTICGEHIIVAEGKENIDFCNIINMNETSAYLWEKIQKMDCFTADDMAKLLTEEYEIDYSMALEDAKTLAEQWSKAGIID